MSIDPEAIINTDALPWHDYEAIRIEAQRIRRDITTADDLLKDAITRYKKKKFSVRSKKQAEEITTMFVDLDGYSSTDEIQDAYGYICIMTAWVKVSLTSPILTTNTL